jgi:hypothetical protein
VNLGPPSSCYLMDGDEGCSHLESHSKPTENELTGSINLGPALKLEALYDTPWNLGSYSSPIIPTFMQS